MNLTSLQQPLLRKQYAIENKYRRKAKKHIRLTVADNITVVVWDNGTNNMIGWFKGYTYSLGTDV
jgi:hypothetical protein